ncbi:serine/threonine-protein kinase [Spirillospora sp. NPDC029432]|uniref:serine/threonine-protein kinase n=1 Tax=Spirillospora sp. NPDC029432 TaxID=3154599 RepID=UPI003451AAA8
MTPRMISSRYELVELLGRGGMGAVWRAVDRTLDREVAIKEVALPRGLDEAAVERVYARTFREARSAARLDHPGIVTVHDVIEEDGRPWIVMRLVRAPALDRVLADGGPLPAARAAAIGLDLLDALRAAHAAGVVHRDVKPGNVLLPEHRAVLTDFGIATMAGDETLTQAGAIVGSPAYLAPEQARHQRATPASDLWSLGGTLYAAVEGRPPFQRADLWGVMAAVLTDDPDPPRLAGPLAPVLDGLLRKEPERRLSHDETERLLRQAARGAPAPVWVPPGGRNVTLPPPVAPPTVETPLPPARRSGPRWPVIVPAAVLGAIVVAGAVVLSLFVANSSGERPQASGSPGTSAASPSAQSTVVPDGYKEYRGPVFAAAVPRAWKEDAGNAPAETTFNDPEVKNRRGIVVQKVASTTGREGEYLAQAERSMRTRYENYERLSFDPSVPYLGGTAAQFEFTFTREGVNGRARVRLLSFDGSLYLILMISRADLWTGSTGTFDTFLGTFRHS